MTDIKCNSSKDVYDSREAGAILVLLALMTLALVSLLALAIDTAMTTAAKSQQQLAANSAALAALERYYATPDGSGSAMADKLAPKLTAAALRASEVTGLNIEAGVAKNFYTDSSKTQSDIQGVTTSSGSAGENGKITPGRWYFNEPTGGCAAFCGSHTCTVGTCPCGGAGQTFTAACFAPSSSSEFPNAIRLEINTNPLSSIQAIFAGALGMPNIALRSRATVTLVPRRAVFLMDLTNSLTWDSHPDSVTAGGRNGYGLMVDPSTAADCATGGGGGNFAYWDTHVFGNPGGFKASDLLIYEDMTAAERGRFSCMNIPRTGDEAPPDSSYPAGLYPYSDNQIYLVDTVNRPEPLYSIIEGINQALTRFRQRSVTGDLIGVVGFDDNVLPSRASLSEPYTSAGDTYQIGLVAPNSSEFENLLAATDTTTSMQSRLNRKFFIPRSVGSTSNSMKYRNPAYTDLQYGLQVALEMLMYGHEEPTARTATPPAPESAFSASDNFVVVFTDGLSTCGQGLSPRCTASTLDKNGNTKPDIDDYWSSSMLAVTNLINSRFAPNKVAVHFALTGNQILPNTVVRKDPVNGGCLQEKNSYGAYEKVLSTRAFNPAWADIDLKNFWYADFIGNYGSPFYYTGAPPMSLTGTTFEGPNGLATYVQSTGGTWMPLRPACTPPAVVAPDVRTALGACNDKTNPSLINFLNTRCDALTTKNTDMSDYIRLITSKWIPTGSGMLSTTDGWGVLYCDPYCRSKKDQVKDYLEDIMSQNPFVLVE